MCQIPILDVPLAHDEGSDTLKVLVCIRFLSTVIKNVKRGQEKEEIWGFQYMQNQFHALFMMGETGTTSRAVG